MVVYQQGRELVLVFTDFCPLICKVKGVHDKNVIVSTKDTKGAHKRLHTGHTDHIEQGKASEQHSSRTSDQATLHDTWRPKLCIQDLGYSGNKILVLGSSHQGPRTMLTIHVES